MLIGGSKSHNLHDCIWIVTWAACEPEGAVGNIMQSRVSQPWQFTEDAWVGNSISDSMTTQALKAGLRTLDLRAAGVSRESLKFSHALMYVQLLPLSSCHEVLAEVLHSHMLHQHLMQTQFHVKLTASG